MSEPEDSVQHSETETSPPSSPATDDTDRGNTVTTSRDSLVCSNCDELLIGAFCSSCGQKATRSRRLDVRLLFDDLIGKALNLDSSLLRTFVGLTFRPGSVCREYVNGKRTLYTNPVTYLLLFVVLNAVANSLIRSVTGYRAHAFELVEEDWNGPLTLLFVVPMAFSVALAFRRTAHTLAETYVVILYSLTHASLLTIPISSILAPFMDSDFVSTSDSNSSFYMQWGSFALPVMFGFWCLFLVWTAKDFYGVSWFSASVKMLGALARFLIPALGAVSFLFAFGWDFESLDEDPFVYLLLFPFAGTAYVATIYQWPRVMKWIIRIVTVPLGLFSLFFLTLFTFATEEMLNDLEISNAEEASAFVRLLAVICFLSVVTFFCPGEAGGESAGDVQNAGLEGADESPPAPTAAPDAADNSSDTQSTGQSDKGDEVTSR